MFAGDAKEEHPKAGEELAEATEEESNVAKAAVQLLVIGVFVNAKTDLLQTKTDNRYE